MIPVIRPIGRATAPLTERRWELNQALCAAVSEGRIADAKRISRTLDVLEAADA